MATCDPSTILAAGKAFYALDDQQLRVSCITSLATVLLTFDPGADVTPAAILARGKALQGLDDRGIRTYIYQSLCMLNGG